MPDRGYYIYTSARPSHGYDSDRRSNDPGQRRYSISRRGAEQAMAQGEGNSKELPGLLELGVKLGYLTADQVNSVGSLQRQMRRAGITLPVGQTLLERKYI